MMTNDDNLCPKCGSDEIDVECFGSGLVPAMKDGNKWVAADPPGIYIEWEYGDAQCVDCGEYV